MIIVSEVKAEILEQIGVGEGRNSTVWRALDPQLGGSCRKAVINQRLAANA
jgi:hypothetical protein